jgi:hypothetical protein
VIAQLLISRMDIPYERRCSVFAGSVAAAWALCAGPAYWMAGQSGLLGSAVAAGLCLVPGLLVLAMAGRLKGPTGTVVLTVGSSIVRLLFVAGVGSVLYFSLEQFTFHTLVIWLIAFYLLTLALETGLLLSSIGK